MEWLKKDWEKGKKITFSKIHEKTGLRNVIGIAINGNYAIAGPLYICGVMFKSSFKLKDISSAKSLSRNECDTLAREYRNDDRILWDFSMIPPGQVIFSSAKEAVRLGIINILGRFPYVRQYDIILSEPFEWGIFIPDVYKDTPTFMSIHASDYCDLVSVASVLARSAREHYMVYLHKQFPEFGWDSNAGHGTSQHIDAIKTFGVSVEHRGLDQVKSLKGSSFKIYGS
jgi:ribonuclease HII